MNNSGDRGYPRPQLVRAEWTSLNGPWDFALDPDCGWDEPAEVAWSGTIVVPFAPETPASGIGDTGFFPACWYRRIVRRAPRVDVTASGCCCTSAPSTTPRPSGSTAISPATTRAATRRSPSTSRRSPRRRRPADDRRARRRRSAGSRQAARQAGLAARAALDLVPAHDRHLADGLARASFPPHGSAASRWTPNLERWEIGFEAWVGGDRRDGCACDVQLQRAATAARRRHATRSSPAKCTGASRCPIPGIDDYRNELLWSPEQPTLIDAELELWGDRGELARRSVAATRRCASIAVAGRPLHAQRPALPAAAGARPGLLAGERPDRARRRGAAARRGARQGDGLQRRAQAPEDRGPALPLLGRSARAAGVGGDAERLPLHPATRSSAVTREWMEAIDRDYSHPCIIAWVPFNESWGVPNLPDSPRRAALRPGALPPDQDARPDPAGDRQRRLGERRDRHHRHPRLRRTTRSASRAATTPTTMLPRLFRRERPGRAAARARGQTATRTCRSCSPSSAASPARDDSGHVGLLARAQRRRSFAAQYEQLLEAVRLARPAVRASATRSSPTRIRRPTACCTRDRTPKIPARADVGRDARRAAPTAPGRRAHSTARRHPPATVPRQRTMYKRVLHQAGRPRS